MSRYAKELVQKKSAFRNTSFLEPISSVSGFCGLQDFTPLNGAYQHHDNGNHEQNVEQPTHDGI